MRGRDTKLNVLIPPGCSDDRYSEALEQSIEILERIGARPNAVMFDAGFEAYNGDGLAATMRAASSTYHFMYAKIVEAFKPTTVIAILEGGYTVGLERGLPAFATSMAGLEDSVRDEPTRTSSARLSELKRRTSKNSEAFGSANSILM